MTLPHYARVASFGFFPFFLVAAAASAQIGSVDSIQRISETYGGFGGALGTGFGEAVAGLGDLDGNGIGDLAVGEAGHSFSVEGRVWILLLNADGTVASEQLVTEGQGGFGGVLGGGDDFGTSLAALGDLDGDGVPDLAVGAAGDDTLGTNQGAVWILFLNADGTVKAQQEIDETAGGFGGTLDPEDAFGRDVTCLGDLNGDGHADLAVGAYRDDDGGTDQGAIWLLFLNANGTVQSHEKISESGGFIGQLDPGDYLGFSVEAIGDLNDDGVVDLVAGALYDDDGGNNWGALWVLFLNSAGGVVASQKISDTEGGFNGTVGVLGLGISLGALGDLDADGVEDVAAGHSHYGDDKGAVRILFLNPDGTVKAERLNPTGENARDFLGWAVACPGDLDGDGTVELAAGAPGDDDGAGDDNGAVWILFLEGPDVTPPVLSHPPMVQTLDPKVGLPGEHVYFTVTASDDQDPSPSVVCVPPSGSFFPRGTTIVTCTATDDAGNESVRMFPVLVTPTIGERRL